MTTQTQTPAEVVAARVARLVAVHGVTLDVSAPRRGVVYVARIIVPESQRGTGVGSLVMRDLADLCDVHGWTLALTPSTDFGTPRARLVSFYKALGFVMNSGRAKDFEISAEMYRRPASN